MPKLYTLKLTDKMVDAILTALPYVGDREIEEEVDLEDRIGEFCDAVQFCILAQMKKQGWKP